MDYLTPPPECNNPYSPRVAFQWSCLVAAKGPVLNVGCADDPLRFEDRVTHFDCDDWGEHFSQMSDVLGKVVPFIQGDAHELGEFFAPGDFDTIIFGDIVEHLGDPYRALTQAAQICRALCVTVWEEWRLPGFGKHVAAGQASADRDAQACGYAGVVAHQKAIYPIVRQFPEEELPHLCHIWQFSDEMVAVLVNRLARENGMDIRFSQKVFETTHAGHDAFNWLIYLVKE